MSENSRTYGGHLEKSVVTISTGIKRLGTSRSTLYRRQGDPGYPKIYRDSYGGRSHLKSAEIDDYIDNLKPIQGGSANMEGHHQ